MHLACASAHSLSAIMRLVSANRDRSKVKCILWAWLVALVSPPALSQTFVVPAADGAYPLAAEVAWRFEQRAAVPTRIQRGNTRDALRAFCAGRNKFVLVARPMLREELDTCAAQRVRYVEVPFALDAVIAVTGRGSGIRADVTGDQLARLWTGSAAN